MNEDKLKVIATDGLDDKKFKISKISKRDEVRAKFERMWLLNPSQFDPERNVIQRAYLNQFYKLMANAGNLQGKNVVDLGCGKGVIAKRLANEGANVTAIDIASNALEPLEALNIPNLSAKLEYVPRTTFSDNAFDLVIAKDLISYLPEEDFRLFFSELARLVTAEGFVIASTPIDIDASDSLQKFISLSETEMIVKEWVFCYYALYIRLVRILSAPSHFVHASIDREYRDQELSKRHGMNKKWFAINSSSLPAKVWSIINLMVKPTVNYVKQSHRVLSILEKICRGISPINGISYVLFIGKRRPLMEPTAEEQKAFDRPIKKRIWE